jgi:hypothetical protein
MKPRIAQKTALFDPQKLYWIYLTGGKFKRVSGALLKASHAVNVHCRARYNPTGDKYDTVYVAWGNSQEECAERQNYFELEEIAHAEREIKRLQKDLKVRREKLVKPACKHVGATK